MPLSDIQPPATQFFLTGWGAPLVYAPDRCQLAEVGPMDPIKWINSIGKGSGYIGIRLAGINPLCLHSTIYGLEWRENDTYKFASTRPQVTPSIKSVNVL